MIIKNCHPEEFAKQFAGKKVVCFGAGRYVENVITEFPQYDLLRYIDYFWDNDSRKWGTHKKIGEKFFLVSQPGVWQSGEREKVVVITSDFYKEILMQLEQMNIEELECYVADFIKCCYYDDPEYHYKKNENIELKKSAVWQIPKIIHYFWLGKKKLPDVFKQNIETWRKFCPDYKIIEWNEGNYDFSKNQYMKEAFEAQIWGFVPDYARLDVLYRFGGIYLDTDVEVLKNLDELLFYKAFAGFQNTKQVNFGQGFGAQKEFPLLREMMQQYETLHFKNEDGSFNLKPSPEYQTTILQKHGLKTDNTKQLVADMAVFSTEYFCPKSTAHGLTTLTRNTYSIHHFAASWIPEDEPLYQREYKDVLIQNEEGKIIVL